MDSLSEYLFNHHPQIQSFIAQRYYLHLIPQTPNLPDIHHTSPAWLEYTNNLNIINSLDMCTLARFHF